MRSFFSLARTTDQKPMANSFFITSTGTDIGKTFITQALLYQLRNAGEEVHAYKPLISGFDETAIEQSDSGQLLHAMGRDATIENVAEISPWRFREPLSPHIAAELEGRHISLPALYNWCSEKIHEESITLIEGVGGVMVPLNRERTVLDWMDALALPTILVVGSYLGTLSHTLTAIHVMQAQGITLAGLVISESNAEAMAASETRDSLRGLIPDSLPVCCVPYTKEGFAATPNLLSLME